MAKDPEVFYGVPPACFRLFASGRSCRARVQEAGRVDAVACPRHVFFAAWDRLSVVSASTAQGAASVWNPPSIVQKTAKMAEKPKAQRPGRCQAPSGRTAAISASIMATRMSTRLSGQLRVSLQGYCCCGSGSEDLACSFGFRICRIGGIEPVTERHGLTTARSTSLECCRDS